MLHKTVLLKESIDALDLHAGDAVVDATLGSGGHVEEIVNRFGGAVEIVGIDLDQDALDRTAARLEKRIAAGEAKISFHCGSFRNLDQVIEKAVTVANENHAAGKVNGILFDLGWSTDQFEDSGRGFSFQKDEPLAMTFSKVAADPSVPTSSGLPRFTAKDIVNGWEESNIADVIYGYGEERYARRIAKAIVEARDMKPIETTGELVEIISRSVPSLYRRGKIHFATRTFQALRIAVNDELAALKEALWKAFDRLAPGGRLAVISFHSLEDRIVKWYFREKEGEGIAEIVTKRPITPSAEEEHANRRSRSAKLRILKKK